ncbi:MAG TPA: metal ABC transporter substrate-binding protein [Candidatus Binatia bacterium]|nr:metal ABC transporter substrate-binding protein [Candidatus Binatia bacterium]
MRRSHRLLWPALALGLTMLGCEQGPPAPISTAAPVATPPAPPPRPLVVASFYPLYDFARNVAGERAEVISLVPPGVEPHDWEPSPADIVRLQKARAFIINGAGFEPWVDALAADITAGGVLMVNASEGITLLKATGAAHEHDHQHRRGEGRGHRAAGKQPERMDSHVWLDPILAKIQVERIRAGLTEADPTGADDYAAGASAYLAKLDALHDRFDGGLRACARRDVVVSHAAFAYLARRYRLTMIPVMGLAPEAEPSPAELVALVRLARQKHVRYIFFESLVSAKLAETLAREVGAKTLVLDPVEGANRRQAAGGKDYLTVMDDNLKNLRIALDCP